MGNIHIKEINNNGTVNVTPNSKELSQKTKYSDSFLSSDVQVKMEESDGFNDIQNIELDYTHEKTNIKKNVADYDVMKNNSVEDNDVVIIDPPLNISMTIKPIDLTESCSSCDSNVAIYDNDGLKNGSVNFSQKMIEIDVNKPFYKNNKLQVLYEQNIIDNKYKFTLDFINRSIKNKSFKMCYNEYNITVNDGNFNINDCVNHCRNLKYLKKFLFCIDFNQILKCNTMIELLCYLTKNKVPNIGKLSIYDLTVAISKHFDINIDYVFAVGYGPKEALKKLNIKPCSIIIHDVRYHFTTIKEVLEAFDKINHVVDKCILNSNNPDHLESYLCLWNKRLSSST